MADEITSAVKTTLELRLTLFSEDRFKAFVISHERSGTHFLMNSLAKNFGYVNSPWINLDIELGINFHSSNSFQDFLSAFHGRPIANLLKSHHAAQFYEEMLSKLSSEYRILYIHRNVFDTMRSYHRFLNQLPWSEGPKVPTIREFIRTPPFGAMTRYQSRHAPTVVHRWKNHVHDWLSLIQQSKLNGMMAVRFEDLAGDFDNTMDRISDFLRLPKPDSWIRPAKGVDVILPTSNPSADDQLTDEDQRWIREVVGNEMDQVDERRIRRDDQVKLSGASSAAVGS